MTEKQGFIERHPHISIIACLLFMTMVITIILSPDGLDALLGETPHLEVGQTYHLVQFNDLTGQERMTPQGMVTFHNVVVEWKPGQNADWSLPETGFTILPSADVAATECTITLLTEYTANIAVPLEGATACH